MIRKMIKNAVFLYFLENVATHQIGLWLSEFISGERTFPFPTPSLTQRVLTQYRLSPIVAKGPKWKKGGGMGCHDRDVERFEASTRDVIDFVCFEEWSRTSERNEGRGWLEGEFVGGLVGWPILDPCWSDSFKSLPTVTEKRERVGATTSVFSD